MGSIPYTYFISSESSTNFKQNIEFDFHSFASIIMLFPSYLFIFNWYPCSVYHNFIIIFCHLKKIVFILQRFEFRVIFDKQNAHLIDVFFLFHFFEASICKSIICSQKRCQDSKILCCVNTDFVESIEKYIIVAMILT